MHTVGLYKPLKAPFLLVHEVAALFGVKKPTVVKYVIAGKLHPCRDRHGVQLFDPFEVLCLLLGRKLRKELMMRNDLSPEMAEGIDAPPHELLSLVTHERRMVELDASAADADAKDEAAHQAFIRALSIAPTARLRGVLAQNAKKDRNDDP